MVTLYTNTRYTDIAVHVCVRVWVTDRPSGIVYLTFDMPQKPSAPRGTRSRPDSRVIPHVTHRAGKKAVTPVTHSPPPSPTAGALIAKRTLQQKRQQQGSLTTTTEVTNVAPVAQVYTESPASPVNPTAAGRTLLVSETVESDTHTLTRPSNPPTIIVSSTAPAQEIVSTGQTAMQVAIVPDISLPPPVPVKARDHEEREMVRLRRLVAQYECTIHNLNNGMLAERRLRHLSEARLYANETNQIGTSPPQIQGHPRGQEEGDQQASFDARRLTSVVAAVRQHCTFYDGPSPSDNAPPAVLAAYVLRAITMHTHRLSEAYYPYPRFGEYNMSGAGAGRM